MKPIARTSSNAMTEIASVDSLSSPPLMWWRLIPTRMRLLFSDRKETGYLVKWFV